MLPDLQRLVPRQPLADHDRPTEGDCEQRHPELRAEAPGIHAVGVRRAHGPMLACRVACGIAQTG